jgi:hypothetical protein
MNTAASLRKTLPHELRQLPEGPRFHGNGFVQLYLRDAGDHAIRLHVFSEALPPLANHNAMIHDHTFDMYSTVLIGGICHMTYTASPRPMKDRSHTHDLFELGKQEGELKTRPKGDGSPVALKETGVYLMQEGCEYKFARGELHQTQLQAGYTMAATLMKKVRQSDDPPFPFVVAPKGERPMDAFGPHAPPVEAMWAEIETALDFINLSGLLMIQAALKPS